MAKKPLDITIEGMKEFKRAINRNPLIVKREVAKFLVRSIAVYNMIINRNPWRVGMSGGGVPVDTGNLRDTHRRIIRPFHARIFPTSIYAKYVHGRKKGERNSRTGVMSRPWLDHAKKKGRLKVIALERKLLKNVVRDLAK